jgi:hypothetical protein
MAAWVLSNLSVQGRWHNGGCGIHVWKSSQSGSASAPMDDGLCGGVEGESPVMRDRPDTEDRSLSEGKSVSADKSVANDGCACWIRSALSLAVKGMLT